ncbi:MAG: glycosyltransferase [Planctomycetota bacterium]|jgi:glycosyltransferase involved in cell wall biosynthesis
MTLGDIHVLHAMPVWQAGGMELALARVIRLLRERGMHHTVVAIKGAPGRAFEPACKQVHYMRAGDADVLLPYRLWRLIRRLKPSIIHAHNWGGWPEVALARLLALRPVPLIFSFHGLPDAGAMPRRRRIAFRVLSRLSTCLFTVSQAARRMLVDQVGLPPGRLSVINNGVDTDRFSPAGPFRDRRGRVIVGSVGSLTPVKNQQLLIRACAQVVRSGVDVELRIAGQGPLAAELARLGRAVGLDERFLLAGHVQDVPGFLRGLDVFALPSRTESHPNALLEAMACSLPCIASNVHGIPEILDGGRLGVLVDPGDAAGLARAIADLAGCPQRRAPMGRAAREHVCRRYSMERMVAQYAELYASVAAGPRRRRTIARLSSAREA